MDKIEASSDSSPYFSSPSSFASFSKAVAVTAQTQVPVSSQDPRTILTILGSAFYDQPVHILAKALLGKVIVRQLEDGTQLRGRIVETEGPVI
jgi:Methylpurine-DNA glycosylase (MPG)